jgi:DNA-binding NarL/FixJ family response regulator
MNQKQLLIVDDSPLILSRLRSLLEGVPGLATIDSTGTYAGALDRLSRTPAPDLVLLDINLPDSNGIELLRHLRRHHPSIIVVMLSNQGGLFYRELCLRLGASHYIDKSTEFEFIPTLLSSLFADPL